MSKEKIYPKLNTYEAKLEKALSLGDYKSVSNIKETKALFKEAAKNYRELQSSKRITIRVNQADLLKVRAKATRNKIPYQTLINTLIHQFAEGNVTVII